MNKMVLSIKRLFGKKQVVKPRELKSFEEMTLEDIRDEYQIALKNIERINNDFDYADDVMLETIIHRYDAAVEYAKALNMLARQKEQTEKMFCETMSLQ